MKEVASQNDKAKIKENIKYQCPNERALHKIVSNTLKYYQFNDNYNADIIMKLYAEHNLIQYAGVATNEANPKDLNSIIDLGEYPIASVFNKRRKQRFDDLENQSDSVSENGSVKSQIPEKKKRQKYSDLSFLPPRPNKYLDVITYSECSPNFEIREDQVVEETLQLTNAERGEFLLTISQINNLLKPLRGRVATYDRFILLYLMFGFLLAATLGVICGIFFHYAISIVIGTIYFSILGGFIYIFKKKSTMLIRKSHL